MMAISQTRSRKMGFTVTVFEHEASRLIGIWYDSCRFIAELHLSKLTGRRAASARLSEAKWQIALSGNTESRYAQTNPHAVQRQQGRAPRLCGNVRNHPFVVWSLLVALDCDLACGLVSRQRWSWPLLPF